MRKFEKISYNQFIKDFGDNKELYDMIVLPKRGTNHSAGYDFMSLDNCVIKPKESHVFKTGVKVSMNEDEMLLIVVRSSVGFKYNVCLSNNVGVIDSDFYNNPENEGHIGIKLINHGEKDYVVNIGDRIAQGLFIKYLTVDNEEEINYKRIGGSGSTDRKEGK